MRQIFKSHLQTLIEYEFSKGNRALQVTGIHSFSQIAYMISSIFSEGPPINPLLFVVGSDDAAEQLVQAISFFAPKVEVSWLPSWDSLPSSGLELSNQVKYQRLRALKQISDPLFRGVFVASISAIMQITLPSKLFKSLNRTLKKGDILDADTITFLKQMGYREAPLVEDPGQIHQRGHILDIFSPFYDKPIRIELFGDQIESIRFFSAQTQLSDSEEIPFFHAIVASEVVYTNETIENGLRSIQEKSYTNLLKETYAETLKAIHQKIDFPLRDFLSQAFYLKKETALDYFPSNTQIYFYHDNEIQNSSDLVLREIKQDGLDPNLFYVTKENLEFGLFDRLVHLNAVDFDELKNPLPTTHYSSSSVTNFLNLSNVSIQVGQPDWEREIKKKLGSWIEEGYVICISARNENSKTRLFFLLDRLNIPVLKVNSFTTATEALVPQKVILIDGLLPESHRFPIEKILFLSDSELLGKKVGKSQTKSDKTLFDEKASILNFADLNVGDLVVHKQHGIGIFEGLKVMDLGQIQGEFVQIKYRDNDKLYLPVFRMNQIQKYTGPTTHQQLDRLGGQTWEKTKVKVSNAIRDLAADLIKLYAERSVLSRPPYSLDQNMIESFESQFPFEETPDQSKAIQEIYQDLQSTRPMDRLICGDVGFGKTEVAMRAAFVVASNGKQVAIICPTTVLSFQHYEGLLKRFKGWDFKIDQLNRLISASESKSILKNLKDGVTNIVVGTHRLLSQDVEFKNLGLLIIDEEQKFGVTHKEKLRKIKTQVDTLTLSATPIPRTLNFSLMGIRDLSLINTPPSDRLSTRTFVTKWNDEIIRKAILNEMARGGQIYFIHNRIQSIYDVQSNLRRILPDTVRLKVAHGQLPEEELEQTMLGFFKHEFDVLICTAIVESGMDVPKANTIFIDQPQLMGLSQLYQLRGRVGRSKERAYCYLLLPKGRELEPKAAERLRILKENSELGSGLRIAHYDLELRGSGNILGEAQSGHISAVGYELYMELLEEAVSELKGNTTRAKPIDPEINLRIPALIPDTYIDDIRIRLAYYKAISLIQEEAEFEKMEDELRDRFGNPPDQVKNLLGLALIRSLASKLGAIDLSQGTKNIILTLSDQTPINPELAIQLAMRENKKYQLLPNNRLAIRINEVSWPRVYEELETLIRLAT
jgi:transcription-repair coupling factor (superfamily II helicase)